MQLNHVGSCVQHSDQPVCVCVGWVFSSRVGWSLNGAQVLQRVQLIHIGSCVQHSDQPVCVCVRGEGWVASLWCASAPVLMLIHVGSCVQHGDQPVCGGVKLKGGVCIYWHINTEQQQVCCGCAPVVGAMCL